MLKRGRKTRPEKTAVTLRTVAARVGLAPCSISAVLNNSPAAVAIPQRTKDRVLRAVRRLNYRPNFSARSLRTKRTFTVALLASDIGNPQAARIIAGVEDFLREKNYSLLISSCDGTPEWFDNHAMQLLQRGVESIVAIDATPPSSFAVPIVFIDLPACNVPQPITNLKRQRLTAMGEAAAQSALTQIERGTTHLTRVALTAEPLVGLLPPEAAITVRRLPAMAQFVD